MPPEATDDGRKEELRSFLFLTVVMVPVLSVMVVAGYGFAVWMFQLLAGPPTG
jgi:nitrate reductase NapE